MMMGFGFLLMILFVILIVLVLAYIMGWRPQNLNLGRPREQRDEMTPLEILKERYARGEITKEEYERMRADLEQ